jgi:threonyl-tRNA synthetase
MATQTSNSVNLLDILCQDPVFGSIDRYLQNGGSWYEADQMYWRIIQKQAFEQLRELTAAKPTKSNQEKAQSYLEQLKETTTQLLPKDHSVAVFQRADQAVKTWAPPKAAPKKKIATMNVFAALNEDSEEE